MPIIVLADDLTGAAEVAAIAHEAGLRAVVLTQLPRTPVEADVLVLDTDTRLARPAAAARRVHTCLARLKTLPHAGFFKKTDSVLRGPVLAEINAAMTVLGLRRALLVAGNPSLGRIIRDGRLLIGGRPLDQTAFGHDPHHPARHADVLSLLGTGKGLRAMSCAAGTPLPKTGVIVGNHRSAADTTRWARAVDAHTMPAGGADFFRAWLRRHLAGRRNPASGRVPPHAGPSLLLHGTTSAPADGRAMYFNGLRPPSIVRVAAALRQREAVAVSATFLTLNDPLAPPVISRGFASLVSGLRDAGTFRHLLIAGGATAATVLHALDWRRLEVVRVWAPGVVSLRPISAPGFIVTLKPGSYRWPAGIRRSLPRLFS